MRPRRMPINAFTGSFCPIRVHFAPQLWEDGGVPELDEERVDGLKYGSPIRRHTMNAVIKCTCIFICFLFGDLIHQGRLHRVGLHWGAF